MLIVPPQADDAEQVPAGPHEAGRLQLSKAELEAPACGGGGGGGSELALYLLNMLELYTHEILPGQHARPQSLLSDGLRIATSSGWTPWVRTKPIKEAPVPILNCPNSHD